MTWGPINGHGLSDRHYVGLVYLKRYRLAISRRDNIEYWTIKRDTIRRGNPDKIEVRKF